MKELCAKCPINLGFGENERLYACGDPPARCVQFRGKLVQQIEGWQRLSNTAEITRSGVLPLEFLRPSDHIVIISTKAGVPYGETIDRTFQFKVEGMQEDGLRGKVIVDTYNDFHPDFDERKWAVEPGVGVVIHGAYGKEIFNKQIEVGKPIDYTPDEPGDNRYGMLVQEILIYDPITDVQMPLFETDPSAYRAPNPQN